MKPAILFLGRVLRFEALTTLGKGCDSILGEDFFLLLKKESGLGEKSGLLEMRPISGVKIVCVYVESGYIPWEHI